MHNRRHAIALSIGALFNAAFDNLIQRSSKYLESSLPDAKAERRRQRQQARREHISRRGWSNAKMSGKGARECARRRGGNDWANFKAIDRARRGMPA